MATSNGTGVTPDEFRAAFARVRPLIEKEWPSVDVAALEATGGDLDRLAELVAARIERTRAAVREQLVELHRIATREPGSRVDRLEQLVAKLEARTRDVADRVRAQLPAAEAKLKENLWISLLVALGLGVIVGLVLRLGGRRRD